MTEETRNIAFDRALKELTKEACKELCIELKIKLDEVTGILAKHLGYIPHDEEESIKALFKFMVINGVVEFDPDITESLENTLTTAVALDFAKEYMKKVLEDA